MKASAIIVAAGSGVRLGFDQPKAFVALNRMTLLARSLRTLRAVPDIGEVVIACPDGMNRHARREVSIAGVQIPVKITPGGTERQDSVRIALALTAAEAGVIVVHDAARPFATSAMFEACIDAAARSGAAIVATAVADTLKRIEGRIVVATVARAGLWLAQTPQAFRRSILMEAHRRAELDGMAATDDAELVERCGARVEIVEGSPLNFKITSREDFRLAEAWVHTLE